jgi:hypothetical protein
MSADDRRVHKIGDLCTSFISDRNRRILFRIESGHWRVRLRRTPMFCSLLSLKMRLPQLYSTFYVSDWTFQQIRRSEFAGIDAWISPICPGHLSPLKYYMLDTGRKSVLNHRQPWTLWWQSLLAKLISHQLPKRTGNAFSRRNSNGNNLPCLPYFSPKSASIRGPHQNQITD